ncbi:unnamed protein product [Protopolystoma xenopodis]|uniref:Uncharacterized protein n=1 Tax=Protopolystoma xenopodis TaxID=117903 RepID=A0A3S5B420_9PLAT|nr:unnamed protein product [Protopolystoma xenopodis]
MGLQSDHLGQSVCQLLQPTHFSVQTLMSLGAYHHCCLSQTLIDYCCWCRQVKLPKLAPVSEGVDYGNWYRRPRRQHIRANGPDGHQLALLGFATIQCGGHHASAESRLAIDRW